MQLSANLTWLYPNLDWGARFHAAAIDGFAGAEILLPYDQSPPWYAAQLRSAGLELTLFNTPISAGKGRLGWAAIPGAKQEFVEAFDQARAVAEATGCRHIHVMAGEVSDHAPAAWEQALAQNLEHALRIAEYEDLTLTLEALNRDDMAGYAYHHPSQVIAILREIDSPRLRLQFDYYHCAKEGLDLMEAVQTAAPWIGYVQIAHEHDRTEHDLHLNGLLEAVAVLPDLGYDSWLGCEYQPRTTVAEGLIWCTPLQARGLLSATTVEGSR